MPFSTAVLSPAWIVTASSLISALYAVSGTRSWFSSPYCLIPSEYPPGSTLFSDTSSASVSFCSFPPSPFAGSYFTSMSFVSFAPAAGLSAICSTHAAPAPFSVSLVSLPASSCASPTIFQSLPSTCCSVSVGPTKWSNPQKPSTVPVIVTSVADLTLPCDFTASFALAIASSIGFRSGSEARTSPPSNASARRGRSVGAPVRFRCSTRSWASDVENTSGAPSICIVIFGFFRHATSSALSGFSGGSFAACTAGSAITITVFGFRNDGGAFSFRFSADPSGNSSPGMYWYCAVFRRLTRCTTSTIVPTYAEYNPAPIGDV